MANSQADREAVEENPSLYEHSVSGVRLASQSLVIRAAVALSTWQGLFLAGLGWREVMATLSVEAAVMLVVFVSFGPDPLHVVPDLMRAVRGGAGPPQCHR